MIAASRKLYGGRICRDSVSPLNGLECKLLRRKTASESMVDTLASAWPSIKTDTPTIAYFAVTDPGPGGIVILLKTTDAYGSAICFDYRTSKIRLFVSAGGSGQFVEQCFRIPNR